jgi:MFS family permease
VAKRSYPAPWIFGLSCIPYGVVGSYAATVMPLIAKREHIDLGGIGWLTTVFLLPSWVQFFYAPLVDVGPKRKHWLIIVSAIGALMLLGACVTPIQGHRALYVAFGLAAAFLSGLVSACNGGLMATLIPDEARGKAGAWYMAGNLSGGALAMAAVLPMIDAGWSPWTYGGVLAVMMFVPSLAILWVNEPDRDHVHRLGALFGTALVDAKAVLFTRRGITGFLLFLSPVSTAALVNFFSGMSGDYGASSRMVWFVNGWANGLLTAIGSLVGGYLCDRVNRRGMYLVAGVLTAVCGIAMALSPRNEWTYAVGVCAYFLITGVCYAAYSAAMLETIGTGGKTASTQYALFNSASNIAIWWVGLVDTRFDEKWHVEGVIGADALLNILGVIVLGLVFWRFGAFRKAQPVEAA